MIEKILFVDDDRSVLDGISRQLYRKFEVETAEGGEQALEMITSNGPYAVIVCDMRMPGMDGIELLERVSQLAPHTVRLMLTGNADQQTAIDAVNKGNVFRFMTKPTSREVLIEMLEAALDQYRLVNAEKELLQGTLNGAVSLMREMIGLTGFPLAQDRDFIKRLGVRVALQMKIRDIWQIEASVMLAQMAWVTLPPEVAEKMQNGGSLSPEEKELVTQMPEVGYRLLANIPRLKKVAEIIRYQDKHFDGTGFPDDGVSGAYIPLESRILNVLNDMQEIQHNENLTASQALSQLQQCKGTYDPAVLEAVDAVLQQGFEDEAPEATREVKMDELEAGYILVAGLVTEADRMLLPAGHQINATEIERLMHFDKLDPIREPILVQVG